MFKLRLLMLPIFLYGYSYKVAAQNLKNISNPLTKYDSSILEFNNGRSDSVFLKELAIMAKSSKDRETTNRVVKVYLKVIKVPFNKENLSFIKSVTKHVSDTGFFFFQNNSKKINEVLGKDSAEWVIVTAIERDEIIPLLPEDEKLIPDWGVIQARIDPYGSIGKEIFQQSKTLYSVNHRQFNIFSSIAWKWYNQYGRKRRYITEDFLNDLAWIVFLDCKEKEGLDVGIKLSKKVIKRKLTPNYLDTYANLLYKTGNIEKAIRIQEKALTLPAGNDNKEVISSNLKKMKNGIPTWNNN